MNKSEYAYAVGRIRANEINLLSASDYEQLITAPDRSSAVRLLNDKGWSLNDDASASGIEKELEKAWKLITESVPSPELIEALIIENDFFNLKASLKAYFSDLEPEEYYTLPCITEPELITKAVKTHDFSILSPILAACAEEAYSALIDEKSGQMAEFIIDKASLAARKILSEKAESDALSEITRLKAVQSNIKIALRCSFNGKSPDFALSAMVDGDSAQAKALANAKSANEIAGLIENEYPFLADAVREGFSSFEKACDEQIFKLIKKSAYDVFGPDPVIAYWFTKTFEVRNARIILSAKSNGISADEIRSRVRGVYV